LKSAKWVYLLTGLLYPTSKSIYDIRPESWEILSKSIAEVHIHIGKIGIKLKRVFLTEKDRVRKVHEQYEYKHRFAFYINDGEMDDNLAQRFVDAVMLSLAVVDDVATEETPTAIRIPESCIKKGRIIRIKDVVGDEGVGSEMYFKVVNAFGVSNEVLDYVWRIVPVIVENQSMMDAASFYRESITQAWMAGPDVEGILWNTDMSDMPSSQVERALVETAYQNAFKAVEAIVGEPPKDERKLRLRLATIGINPDEIVGYNAYRTKPMKDTILKKLTDMHQTRDKKAAHGKSHIPRTIGYCELKDKQELARYLLLTHIDFILQ
jgi:hypothetical protein